MGPKLAEAVAGGAKAGTQAVDAAAKATDAAAKAAKKAKKAKKAADAAAQPNLDVGASGSKKTPQRKKADNIKNKSDEKIRESVKGKKLLDEDVDEIAADPNVIDAAKKNKDRLKKIGITGAVGLAALMIIYGEPNPIKAIKKAMEEAGEVFDEATDMFTDAIINGFKKLGIILGLIIGGSLVLWLIAQLAMSLFSSSGSGSRTNPVRPRYGPIK